MSDFDEICVHKKMKSTYNKAGGKKCSRYILPALFF